MKKQMNGWSTVNRFVTFNVGILLVLGSIFSVNSWAQSDTAGGATPQHPDANSVAMNSPAKSQSQVELTTDPSPPQKGNNTVRVKLMSKDGKPIEGAKVTVTFFMPAMAEMGMAAMKAMVTASDKGSGMYEGKGDLGSGGMWQVTVKASKDGHVIATKHLKLNATGGM